MSDKLVGGGSSKTDTKAKEKYRKGHANIDWSDEKKDKTKKEKKP